jgi:hypothetical protein
LRYAVTPGNGTGRRGRGAGGDAAPPRQRDGGAVAGAVAGATLTGTHGIGYGRTRRRTGLIGWRPYLFTLLAAALLAIMVLDVTATRRTRINRCAAVNSLARAGFHREALRQYALVLEAHPRTTCPRAGPGDPTLKP